MVRDQGLSIDQYKTSTELKEWVRKNRNEKYVPPELLEAWQFIVDENGFTKRNEIYPSAMSSDSDLPCDRN